MDKFTSSQNVHAVWDVFRPISDAVDVDGRRVYDDAPRLPRKDRGVVRRVHRELLASVSQVVRFSRQPVGMPSALPLRLWHMCRTLSSEGHGIA